MINEFSNKNIAIIAGPGRSGTSLLMEILGHFGLTLSDELKAQNKGNMRGFFEDKNILAVHKHLFKELSYSPKLPLPEDWQDHEVTKQACRKISNIISRELGKPGTQTWAVKDPRIALLIPLWNQITSELNVTPKYILAIRNPRSFIESLKMQSKLAQQLSEVMWLERTTGMLLSLNSDCYIQHYEDWFSSTGETLVDLLLYLGIPAPSTADSASRLSQIIQPTLNRAQYNDIIIENYWINALYDELQQCRGYGFQSQKLLNIAKGYKENAKSFVGWARHAADMLVRLERKADQKEKILAQTKPATNDT